MSVLQAVPGVHSHLPFSVPVALALSGSSDPHCQYNSILSHSLYTGMNTISESNTMGWQQSISYNGTSVIACSDYNYYTIALRKSNPQGACKDDGYAQTGWAADAASTTHYFAYSTSYWGNTCPSVYYFGSINATHTYKVRLYAGGYNSSCNNFNGEVDYFMDGSFQYFDCLDWHIGDGLDSFTERWGSNSHIGAIGYFNGQYCSATGNGGCDPGTPIPTASVYNNAMYVDSRGRVSWQNSGHTNWNTCDIYDFTTSQC